ncbi:DnaJ sub C member 24 [Dispira parvispora]|uniref:Diphthamide biosynthesis protein 4 n=1 Tax=Dispira parvispora TaxID=1520584 RepID=A0A9W8E157_9FUNG|nr:DnaJ sub C member 24 [Dispira parvispora]
MYTHYDYLQVAPDASLAELKRAYQQRVLRTHPDKVQQRGQAIPLGTTETKQDTGEAELFQRIHLAWQVLRVPEKRRDYDIYLQELEAQSHGVIHDEVHLDELTYDAEEHIYIQPCRCGGEYALADQDISIGADIALCSNCSLRLKVNYTWDSELPTP